MLKIRSVHQELEVCMTPVEREKAAASETVTWAHDDLRLAYGEIGLAVEADERTVRRWQSREVAPRGRHRARLEDLRELRHLLRAVFATPADADEWLHSSVPAFRGRTPISLIRRGQVEKVIDALATMESGAYL
jgi:uncharacterized protein (DUF2384 family)